MRTHADVRIRTGRFHLPTCRPCDTPSTSKARGTAFASSPPPRRRLAWHGRIAVPLVLWFLHGLIVCAVAGADASESGATVAKASDSVCGPRCVQEVLRRRGIDSDLTELIREMQWPDFSAGSSFKELSDALSARGVTSHLVQVKRLSDYSSGEPFIVYLKPAGDGPSGHFIVAQRSGDSVVVWDGPNGSRSTISPPTGVALVASSEDAMEGSSDGGFGSGKLLNVAILLGIGVGLLCTARWKPRR